MAGFSVITRGLGFDRAVPRTTELTLEPSGDRSGVTDDARLASAIASLPNGGTIILAPGNFYSANGIDAHGAHSLIIRGSGGISAGAECATVFRYIGTSAPALNLRSTAGVRVRDVMILATNGAFAGSLIDLSPDATLLTDAALWSVTDCYLGILGTAGVVVNLDTAGEGTIGECDIVGGQYGVQGDGGGGNANAIHIRGCRLGGSATAAAIGVGAGWHFDCCTFELGLVPAIQQGLGTMSGCAITGCWFGDATGVAARTIIELGSGARVSGNLIGGLNNHSTGVSVLAGATGVEIAGNTFTGHLLGIQLASTATDVRIFPNNYVACVTKYTPPTIAPGANAGAGATASITGSDEGGVLSVTAGTGPAAGALATVTLAGARTLTRMMLTPYASAAAASLNAYVATVAGSVITVSVVGTPVAGTTYQWAYSLVQAA